MYVFRLFLLIFSLLLCADANVSAQSTSDTGTREAASAIETIKALLPGQTETTSTGGTNTSTGTGANTTTGTDNTTTTGGTTTGTGSTTGNTSGTGSTSGGTATGGTTGAGGTSSGTGTTTGTTGGTSGGTGSTGGGTSTGGTTGAGGASSGTGTTTGSTGGTSGGTGSTGGGATGGTTGTGGTSSGTGTTTGTTGGTSGGTGTTGGGTTTGGTASTGGTSSGTGTTTGSTGGTSGGGGTTTGGTTGAGGTNTGTGTTTGSTGGTTSGTGTTTGSTGGTTGGSTSITTTGGGSSTTATSGTGSSTTSSGAAISIYKPGWSKQRVLTYAKGSRPHPSTYLTEAYYNDHINRFKTQGGAFMIVEKWIKTSPFPAFAPRKFVMLRSDMENVASQYYQSGRVQDIEDALGYRRGDLKSLDAEIHIIYVDSTRFRFEFPDGNEIGANDLWEPGGKTSGGFRECVVIDKVDPARTITHNKDPEFLHSPYEYKELIYETSWDNKRVRTMPKGSRPPPPSYLRSLYVQNHLAKFNTEGGAFMVVKRWVESTTDNFMSFPLRKFVMLRSDMDKVVAKYQQTGEVSEIETALGYTPGTLAGLEDDLYVFYIDKTKYNFELPDGNEIGANSLWEPEARTSGGFLECVVIDKTNPTLPITHNKQLANLQSQFQYIKVSGVGSACIYQPGWSKSRVLTYTKGSRPHPSTYLTSTYVSDHLNRFKTEGGAFMIVEKWIKTSPFPAFAPRKFVMLRTDMQQVVNQYLQSGRVEDIEDALGYSRNDLKGLDAEIHIIYVDTTKFIFDLPDGNEIGANSLWEPGAKTSGGFRECVLIDKVDSTRTIVHNKNPEDLHVPYEFKELIYRSNWYNKKVREIPKGTRPNPPSYLIGTYVQNHLQKFNTEGGAFMVVKRWVEDTTNSFMSFPPKKFVMLKSDMDKVVAGYRQSLNVQSIEDALGYTPGTLAGLDDDLYVFYLDKIKYQFDLPTGNEIGANSLWEPEARTSGGFLECVVTDRSDPAKVIVHNKNIDNLKAQFTYIKVKP